MSELDNYMNQAATNESSLEPYMPTVPLLFSERSLKTTSFMRAYTQAKKFKTGNEALLKIQEHYFENKKKQESDIRNEASADYLKENQQHINDSISVSPPVDNTDIQAIATVEDTLKKEAYNPDRVERDLIQSMNPLAAKDYIERQADLLAIKSDVQSGLEGTSLSGLAGDIGGLLLLSDQSFVSAEVGNTNWFNSADGVVSRAKEVMAIPDRKERKKAIKEYLDAVNTATSNSLKQADVKSILLNPESRVVEEGIDKASAVFDAITVAGAASGFVPVLAGGVVGKAFAGLGKLKRFWSTLRDINPIKMAAKSGNLDDAAKMNAMATKDAEVADALDIPQDVAATNDIPYSFEGILEGATDGLSIKIREFNNELDVAKDFLKNDIIKEGLNLSPSEKKLFEENAIAAIKVQDDVLDVRPLEATENGMKFEVHFSSDGEADATRIVNMEWDSTDVVEGFKTVEEGLDQSKGFFASPNIKFALDKFTTVLPAVRESFQEARLRAVADSLYKASIKPLGSKLRKGFKKSKEKVDKILIYGDEFNNGGIAPGKVFSYRELIDGVALPNGETIKLNPQEAESYFKQRMVWDYHHFSENARLVEEAKRRGVQVVKIANVEKLGTPYNTPEKARLAVADNEIFDPRTQKLVGSEKLEEAYNSGYKLIKTDTYEEVEKGVHTKWLLSKAEDIKGHPKQMLNYREGHITKITEDGVFVVKQPKLGLVNGKEVNIGDRALGLFTSKKLAEGFVRKSIAKDTQQFISEGLSESEAVKKATARYKLVRDREVADEDSLSDPLLYGSGPYTGARSTRPPFLDEEGKQPIRINAFESLQRALNHSSKNYPLASLKNALQTRWLASAKPFIPAEYSHDFTQAIHHLQSDPNGTTYRALSQLHSYIRHVAGMPSDGVIKTRKSIQRMADSLEANGFDRVAKLLNTKLNHNDPTGVAKTIVFHSLLGGFNLSQIIVQGLGSTVAMAIDPQFFIGATKLSFAFNALDQVSDSKDYLRVMKFLKSTKMFKEGELEHAYDAWKKSGLREDLLNSADYAEFSRGWEVTNSVLEAGTLPFRMGEANMRRYTFASSYLKHIKDIKKPITRELFDKIMNRQIDLSLNMSRRNKAIWQEGAILSVTTQFKQVTAKYLEALLGGQFSPAERRRLILGQVFLFGMHGAPGGQTLNQVLQGYSQWDEKGMDPEFSRLLNEGFARYAMDAAGLDDLNLISRVSLGDAIDDFATSISTGTMLEFLGGPFYSHVIKGVTGATKEGLQLLNFITGDHKLSAKFQASGDFGRKLFSAFPIVDDLDAASFMYLRGQQLDAKGRVVATADERTFSIAEMIGVASGFGDRAGIDLYRSGEILRASEKRLDDVATKVAKYIRKSKDGLSSDDTKDIVISEVKYMTMNEDEENIVWDKVYRQLKDDSRLKKGKDAVFNALFRRGIALDGSGTSETQLQVKEEIKRAKGL